jgi:hypothetical protein
MGPGEITVSSSQDDNGQVVNADVRLFNFDIDVAEPLKSEHLEFLRHQVVPAIQANPRASIVLVGSASRSGPEAHNLGLSRRRAEEVQKALGPVNSQIVVSFGRGAPMSGPHEDKHDRAVFMFVAFPTKIDASFYTDDWSRTLDWDDIVGLDGLPTASINRLNLQVTLGGVPRSFAIGSGAPVNVAPAELKLMAVGMRSLHTISKQRWQLPLAPQFAQPANQSQTFYRLSGSADEVGFVDTSRTPGVAVVNSKTIPITFDVAGWADRGEAQQGVPSSESSGQIDPLHAVGVSLVADTQPDGQQRRCLRLEATMSRLEATDRTRLAKLLGMLGSAYAGERDAAGLAAHRLVQERDLTWSDILCPSAIEQQPATWRDIVQACLPHPHNLSPWEQHFLRGLPRFPRLSPKQKACLVRIADRVLTRAA